MFQRLDRSVPTDAHAEPARPDAPRRRVGAFALLHDHVRRFNAGVRSGDFRPMLELFADDAELAFEGVPVGPFEGREAIAAAYREQPPDDEIRVWNERESGDETRADYAWLAAPDERAGELRLTAADGRIARLVVTFG